MKKLTFLAVAIILSIFLISNCYAQGNAETYIVRVLRVEIRKTDGTWITIATPNQEIDITSANAGATVGSLSGFVPPGSYDNFRLRLSETMRFAGSDDAHYTRAGGDLTITGNVGTAASTATWVKDPTENADLVENVESWTNTAPAGEVTAHLDLNANDGDNYIEVYATNNSSTPITVNADSAISMYFDFDTQGTIMHQNVAGDDIMTFLPPRTGTRFGITVDGTSLTILEANMRIDF